MTSRTEHYLSRREQLAGSDVGPGQRRARSLLADALLRGLLEDHLRRLGVGPRTDGLALLAVGGYGREALSPGSDLDVVVLHAGTLDLDALTRAVLYPLWDASVALDHSVRTVGEARAVAAEDIRAALGLLSVRHVAGDERLTTLLRSQTLADWRAGARRRLPEVRELASARRDQHGELAYLLEPDLKESAGGLRDVVSLRAVAASWVADVPHGPVDAAEAVLLDVRDALHAGRRRPSDRLLMQEQDRVAAALGLADADALMHRVAEAARGVAFAAERTWRAVDRALPSSAPRRVLAPVRALRRPRGPLPACPLAEGVAEQGGEVVLTAAADPARDPSLVLRAAACAAENGWLVAPASLERLAEESQAPTERWTPSERDWFVRLLGAGPGLVQVWEGLDQAGLVAARLPEWQPLRSRPQRNALHRFTVDRHLVETAVQASALTTRVGRPDVLLVAALLHDVGKALPGDHSEAGAPVVTGIARRMGFSEPDVAVLTLLVRHHLLLPAMATGRDQADPATAAAVVAAVGDTATLVLLQALTEADARAAGPSAWTPWRAGLVRSLVSAVRASLAGPLETLVVPVVEPLTAAAHGPLAAGGAGVRVHVGPAVEGTLPVAVTAPDQPGALATVAGVLTVARLTVRSARTSSQGALAVMEFAVGSDSGNPPDVGVLREELVRALDGTLDVAAKVARRAAAYAQRPSAPVAAPSVRVVPGASASTTVLEVRAHDRPGLVHLVAAALTSAGVDVRSAIVSTLGAEAVDAFYVLEPDGSPLTARRSEQVVAEVLAALAALGGSVTG